MDDSSTGQKPAEQPSPLARFIATGAYSGYAPVAPGTAGSLVGLLLYLIPGFEKPLSLGVAIVVFFFVGAAAAGRLERIHGKDPSIVVIDEVVGMWIALFLLPKSAAACLLAFFLFRLYDIIKPPPARSVERFEGGFGIMLDDVFAAFYANVSVWVLLALFHRLF